jgi:hypothetical protein
MSTLPAATEAVRIGLARGSLYTEPCSVPRRHHGSHLVPSVFRHDATPHSASVAVVRAWNNEPSR